MRKDISQTIALLFVLIIGCIDFNSSSANTSQVKALKGSIANKINCSESGCSGTYLGPEFVNGDDVAHQFSNAMSAQVGDKLKELYTKGIWAK